MTHIADTYAQLLLTHIQGYALWHPSPFDNDPPGVQAHGVEIGDVGVVTREGEFSFLFNICAESDSPSFDDRPRPPGLPTIPLGNNFVQRRNHFAPGETVATEFTISSEYGGGPRSPLGPIPVTAGLIANYTTTTEDGALLQLPWGAEKKDVINLKPFREHARAHGEAWYKLAYEYFGREDINGDLYLVTGHVKSSAWAIAAHRMLERSVSFSLELDLPPIPGGEISYTYRWGGSTSVSKRTGPHPLRQSAIQNQCTAVRGFKLMLKEDRFRRIMRKEALGVSTSDISRATKPRHILPSHGSLPGSVVNLPAHSPRSGSGGQDEQDILEVGSRGSSFSDSSLIIEHLPNLVQTKPYHPSDVINRSLLERNELADIAITHDDTWLPVLQGYRRQNSSGYIPTDAELLEGVERASNALVDEGGYVYLQYEPVEDINPDTDLGSIFELLEYDISSVRVEGLEMLLREFEIGVQSIGQKASVVVRLLNDNDSNVRRLAMVVLAKLFCHSKSAGGIDYAAPDILSCLKDENAEVRGTTVETIITLFGFHRSAVFIEAISQEIPTIVGLLADETAVQALSQRALLTLADDNALARSIRSHLVELFPTLLKRLEQDVRKSAQETFLLLAQKDQFLDTAQTAISATVKSLKGNSPEVIRAVGDVLLYFSTSAKLIGTVEQEIQSIICLIEDPQLQRAAEEVLACLFKDSRFSSIAYESVLALVGLLEGGTDEVGRSVGRLMTAMSDNVVAKGYIRQHVPVILSLINSKPGATRSGILTLAELSDTDAFSDDITEVLPMIHKHLADPDPDIRGCVAEALSTVFSHDRFRDLANELGPDITVLVQDPSPAVQREALIALNRLSRTLTPIAITSSIEKYIPAIVEFLGSNDSRTEPAYELLTTLSTSPLLETEIQRHLTTIADILNTQLQSGIMLRTRAVQFLRAIYYNVAYRIDLMTLTQDTALGTYLRSNH